MLTRTTFSVNPELVLVGLLATRPRVLSQKNMHADGNNFSVNPGLVLIRLSATRPSVLSQKNIHTDGNNFSRRISTLEGKN